MSWRQHYGGNFLSAGDLPNGGERVTIMEVTPEILSKGERAKLVADLGELDKRWVLNATNCERLEELFGSDDPDEWRGPVEIFNDHSVRGPNGEKGGIRCRRAKSTKKRTPKKPQLDSDLDDFEDDA